jgi:SAM-dependent methyltransferase
MRAGRISSKEPLSRKFGFDRGTPIDRAYIESFLSEHASDIAGRVLEVGDDSYSSRFGADRVTRQDILNLDPHAAATFVGDLGQPGVLPVEAFDCIILTQTLQYVFDCATAVDQLRAALRPGGVLLMTVPGISSTSGDDRNDSFYWTFTRDSV